MTIDSTSGWYVEPGGDIVTDEDEANYDESVGPPDPHLEPGRLVEDDEGVRTDVEADLVAYDSGDRSDLSAEEAAIHVIEE
jgi:Family of unknown function (DUF5709)